MASAIQSFLKIFIYWAVLGLSCGMWDLVSQPGTEPEPPALGCGVLALDYQGSPFLTNFHIF